MEMSVDNTVYFYFQSIKSEKGDRHFYMITDVIGFSLYDLYENGVMR